MNEELLDAMLSEPLLDIADAGFSAQVTSRIARGEVWKDRLPWTMGALAACALAPFVPIHQLTETATRLAPSLAGSAPIAIAVAAIILTVSFEQRLRGWQSDAL